MPLFHRLNLSGDASGCVCTGITKRLDARLRNTSCSLEREDRQYCSPYVPSCTARVLQVARQNLAALLYFFDI